MSARNEQSVLCHTSVRQQVASRDRGSLADDEKYSARTARSGRWQHAARPGCPAVSRLYAAASRGQPAAIKVFCFRDTKLCCFIQVCKNSSQILYVKTTPLAHLEVRVGHGLDGNHCTVHIARWIGRGGGKQRLFDTAS